MKPEQLPEIDLDLQALVAEMREMSGPMQIFLSPDSVLSLVAALQLALRHPGMNEGNADTTRAAAMALIEGARDYFMLCPTVLQLIDAGMTLNEKGAA